MAKGAIHVARPPSAIKVVLVHGRLVIRFLFTSFNCLLLGLALLCEPASLSFARQSTPTLASTMALNASFVSPTADAKVAHMITQLDTTGLLSTLLNAITFWKALLTLFLAAVVYDQGESRRLSACPPPPVCVLTAFQPCTSGRRAPLSALP
jgi:hypothetical protein